MLESLLYLGYAASHFLLYIPFLHTAENPALFVLWFQTFSGQILDFFLTLYSDLQQPGWTCLIFQK